jgi:2-C-methyl-D-erythritol 4-phosphate cytidylyltransferase
VKSSTWAIVVAAGSGTRYGGQKQFATIAGRTVVALAVESVAANVDGVVLVLPRDLVGTGDLSTEDSPDAALLAELGVSTGGGTAVMVTAGRPSRAGSVRAGLERVPDDCGIIVVHDGARPFASPELCRRVLSAVRSGAFGAVPGLPLADTVKRVRGSEVTGTVDRSELVRVQTPQAFDAQALRLAHEGEPEATDDAGLLEMSGRPVVVVPGEEHNLKITSPDDLELAAWWYARRSLLGSSR